MALAVGLLLVGVALLIVGAEVLVRGAASAARRLGISTLVVGMTVVAFGTSTPELVVSIGAARSGVPQLSLGNILGSNIANIGLVLGMTALVYPIYCSSRFIAREVLAMLAFTAVGLIMLWNDSIGFIEGILLALGFVGYTWVSYRRGRQEGVEAIPGFEEEMEKTHGVEPTGATIGHGPTGWIRDIVLTVVGIGLLLLGGDFVINNATTLAELMGVSPRVIGLTVVAIGTSLPELAVSLVAAYRKHPDMVLGNVLGSNMYNLALVGGTTAIVSPPLSSMGESILIDKILLLVVSLACLPIVLSGGKITRWEGAALFVVYIGFIAFLFANLSPG